MTDNSSNNQSHKQPTIKFLGTDKEIVSGLIKGCDEILRGNVGQRIMFYEAVAQMFRERPMVQAELEVISTGNSDVKMMYDSIMQVMKAQREKQVMAMMNGNRTCAGNVVERPVTEQLGFLKSCGEYVKKLCKQIDNAGYQVVQSVTSMFSGNQRR